MICTIAQNIRDNLEEGVGLLSFKRAMINDWLLRSKILETGERLQIKVTTIPDELKVQSLELEIRIKYILNGFRSFLCKVLINQSPSSFLENY